MNIDPQTVIETTVTPELVKKWDDRTMERIELGNEKNGRITDVVSSIRPQNGSVAARSVISAKMHKFHKLSISKQNCSYFFLIVFYLIPPMSMKLKNYQ